MFRSSLSCIHLFGGRKASGTEAGREPLYKQGRHPEGFLNLVLIQGEPGQATRKLRSKAQGCVRGCTIRAWRQVHDDSNTWTQTRERDTRYCTRDGRYEQGITGTLWEGKLLLYLCHVNFCIYRVHSTQPAFRLLGGEEMSKLQASSES